MNYPPLLRTKKAEWLLQTPTLLSNMNYFLYLESFHHLKHPLRLGG